MLGVDPAAAAGFGEREAKRPSRRSVATLAEDLAVHRGTLYNRLRDLTGRSPTDLIADLRFARATSLLRVKGASVSQAAYACGFRSVAYFSRRFRERFGQSPSAWRRQAR